MHYIVYKILNRVNGKSYIGCHKTTNLNDGYMGSGRLIKRAIKKYGLENFEKEILFEFATAEEMFEKEQEIVEIGPQSYNLNEGGYGGFAYINSIGKNINCDIKNYRTHESVMKGYHAGIGAPNFVKPKFNGTEFAGKKHSDESKQQIGLKNSIHQAGEGNSQFGSMWVTNGKSNLKIKKNDTIPSGYYKGRVIKK